MQNQEYFNKLLYNSAFAWWQWDIPSDRVIFNNLKATMLGYDPADFINKGYRVFTDLLHPDDQKKAMDAMLMVLRKESELYQVDYRILSKFSNYHWYMDRGIVVDYDSNGAPSKLRGIVIDLGKETGCGSSIDAIIRLIKKSAADKNEFMFTVCSNCGNAKIEKTKWIPVTDNLKDNLSGGISHGICPECIKKLYPELVDEIYSMTD